MIENKLHMLATNDIFVPPDRQRQDITEKGIEDLSLSISKNGLFHPIIVKRDMTLVVGERRLKAWQRLEKIFPEEYTDGIPARYIDEVDATELMSIELEENIQRADLSWQDEAKAFQKFYEIRKEQESHEQYEDGEQCDYTWAEMSGELNCSDRHCRRMVTVGKFVLNEDKEVIACQSARAAGALLDRRTKRIVENELVTFGEIEIKPEPLVDVDALEIGDFDLSLPPEPIINYNLYKESFLEFCDKYEAEKQFNFVHCDFPYGIGLHESDLYKTETKDLNYEDTEEIYDELCDTLVDATSNMLSASCHFLFWFPMSKYRKTMLFFQSHGFWVEPYPLIWAKSDKMGILPDPTRGPRRIYESAFIMSLGDRKVVKSTVNAAWYPSGGKDKEHASQKPQVMLEDFLRMFIDEDSVVLDPTCGSGTALAAAIQLGAKSVVGLDINAECIRIAEDNCRNQFTLKIKE